MRAIKILNGGCLGLALVILFGCQSDVTVRPPERQAAILRDEPLGSFVEMNQPDAARYFISGVYGLEAGTWRWVGKSAELRFHLKDTQNLNYVMKFAVPAAVITRNGPVRISILINGTNWEQLGYSKDGIYEIEKPVPSKLLKPEADNTVTLEIDKPLPPEGKGLELGFILVRAGFRAAA